MSREPEDDFDEKFFNDPKSYLNGLYERAKQEVRQEFKSDLFWMRFYNKYPHLEAKHEAVEKAMRSNFDSLKDMHKDAAMEKIAELADAASESGSRRRRPVPEDEALVMRGTPENGSAFSGVASPQESLGDIIRARRHQRAEKHSAFAGRKATE